MLSISKTKLISVLLLCAGIIYVPVVSADSCPSSLNKLTVHRLVNAWMEAEVAGLTRPYLAKESCLKLKPKERLWIQKQRGDAPSLDVDFYVDNFVVSKSKKVKGDSKGEDYLVNVLLVGTDSKGEKKQILKDMLFTFPKGGEATFGGCVRLHTKWDLNFIGRSCAKESNQSGK